MSVTDNFFADHLSFSYNEVGDKFYCISYFEFQHLILNQRVHEKQQDIMSLISGQEGSQLIELIKSNAFWNFLNEFAKRFQFSKTLSAINEESRIEMKV